MCDVCVYVFVCAGCINVYGMCLKCVVCVCACVLWEPVCVCVVGGSVCVCGGGWVFTQVHQLILQDKDY